MEFFGPLVLVFVALFYAISGQIVEKGLRAQTARTGISSKGLLWQKLCINEAAVENNVIACLACRGFSRLCFSMSSNSGGSGNNPSGTSSTSKPGSSTTSSTSTTSTRSPGGEESNTASGKAI